MGDQNLRPLLSMTDEELKERKFFNVAELERWLGVNKNACNEGDYNWWKNNGFDVSGLVRKEEFNEKIISSLELSENIECDIEGEMQLMNEYKLLVVPNSEIDLYLKRMMA